MEKLYIRWVVIWAQLDDRIWKVVTLVLRMDLREGVNGWPFA